jgi:hypothetical protein
MVTMEHKQTKPTVSKAYLTNFNLNNFKITESMGLKLLHRGPLEWHCLRTKFHENLPRGSEVISGEHIDRQTGDLISLLSFLESRLKIMKIPHSQVRRFVSKPCFFVHFYSLAPTRNNCVCVLSVPLLVLIM